MSQPTRKQQFESLFPKEPSFRFKQIQKGLFSDAESWKDLTSLPAQMRESLEAIPWMSVRKEQVLISGNGDTHKALLMVEGEKEIETVLMKNPRGSWTICVSSQIGCAMRCGFCATGKMGLTRSLIADEIIDQYRFWQEYLTAHPELSQHISNIVFMGMGEPLANYENVRETLNTILEYTDIGRTRMTVSTVGVLPRLEQILTDDQWPHVRLAVSLHSAVASTRKQIVPTSYDEFLPKLEAWCHAYLEKFGNRRHHLTFEYVMLKGVNDTPLHAQALAKFVKRIGKVRVNLIPYNLTGVEFECSTPKAIEAFVKHLKSNGVTTTTRKTMGDDIAAACGQLIVLKKQ
ncbi:23S rRNA (adenine(2503)-C(2))-methyltransferase RlmN [Candidatus Uhrbacteria bacterium CG_4_9_14_3_um_filter_50_9]|uniref:23S rRNA (Adenine(2503)-C(2))-methyltransferase RlmN n=1 Tax=Candidatus Uhrbacteria bacterium CG_4_9_14_3_um_filter_50_9 TaxID=1975035 RepID=A0A2M7XCE4_9BACT|nr:MAG: 23S rRNA (adenine(2503)-C(2))-methyltransferase RlmN [Candidatus Uhrbacteria bacterium CG_4_9_14_3_um_filter_50_9]